MGLESNQIYIESSGIEDFLTQVSEIKGDIWISCTSPLKHSAPSALGIKSPEGVFALNQLMRSGGIWSGVNTDGLGFVSACRHVGVDPAKAILRIRGGDLQLDRSLPHGLQKGFNNSGNWSQASTKGPWDGSVLDSGQADVAVDLDASHAGGESVDLDGEVQLSLSYGENASKDEFAIIMLAAQHLQACKRSSPSKVDELPNLEEFLSML